MFGHVQQATSFVLHNLASLRFLAPFKTANNTADTISNTTASPTTTITHLIVLIHGLNGAPSDLHYLSNQLINAFPPDTTYCHCTAVNSTSRYSTHDGVDIGGKRVYDDIVEVIKRLRRDGNDSLKYISVIGHSLGGLYARYAITLLHSNHLFQKYNLQPLVFLTLATPHLGIYELHWLMQWGASYVIGQTGKQLLLQDGKRHSGSNDSDNTRADQPLLLQMSTDQHLQALQQFKHHILYSNITGDLSVGYCTASLRPTNPYAQLSNAKLLKLVSKHYDYVVDEQLLHEMQQRSEQQDQHHELAHCPPHLQSTVQTMLENLTATGAVDSANDTSDNANSSISFNITWQRFDVIGRLGLAHTDIVVRSELLNMSHGKTTVDHIVKVFVDYCQAADG